MYYIRKMGISQWKSNEVRGFSGQVVQNVFTKQGLESYANLYLKIGEASSDKTSYCYQRGSDWKEWLEFLWLLSKLSNQTDNNLALKEMKMRSHYADFQNFVIKSGKQTTFSGDV